MTRLLEVVVQNGCDNPLYPQHSYEYALTDNHTYLSSDANV